MTYIDNDYISIDWMYKWLTEQLYKRNIKHDVMLTFYRMRADWELRNERESIVKQDRRTG